ncbi:hypothetical protein L0222_22030 [bacterium]|nr:hypothetical protein [bacterium]MCI0604281.1 hypothetical protein [bacterium]
MNRIAIGLGLAAALIPVSLLLGLSATKSILAGVITGIMFVLFAWGMSRVMGK